MYSISIILTLHNEGILAERSISNLCNIIDFAKNKKNNWNNIELIAVLDNADDLTKQAVFINPQIFNKIEFVDFKDPSLSRNFGVSIAKNEFILFQDGDDYFSHNALVVMFGVFKSHYSSLGYKENLPLEVIHTYNHIAIFPQLLVVFPRLFFQSYVCSNPNVINNMKFTHCYTSRICCPKFLLVKTPYRANEFSYGYEDWDLNNRMLAQGVVFKVANDCVLYYRKKDVHSVYLQHNEKKSIVRNSDIYKYRLGEFIPDNSEESLGLKAKNINKLSLLFTNIIKYVALKIGVLELIQRYLHHGFIIKQDKMKNKQFNQCVDTHKNFLMYYNEDSVVIDQSGRDAIGSTVYFANNCTVTATIYCKICDFLRGKEIVLFIPWIKLGGADKVIIEYLKALDGINVGVITTIEPGDWMNKISVPYLDLNSLENWVTLDEDIQLHILIKSIVNTNTLKIYHCVQSIVGHKLTKFYKNVFDSVGIKIITTLFCPDYDWVNRKFDGYPVMFPELFRNSDIVLSDNLHWYSFFKKLNNDTDFRFKKLSSPTAFMDPIYTFTKKFNKKILWASRICDQKLIIVLEKIILLLPEYTFIIYGDKPLDGENLQYLTNIMSYKNVEMRGTYSHISEIDINEFDLYLYTSMFDGIPTILLDMVMLGIPIVASNVGGVTEVLGVKNPLIVNDVESPDAYVNKIKQFYFEPQLLSNITKQLRATVIEEYSSFKFILEYRTIILELMNDNR